jgi:hypothetical protein
MSFHLIKTGMCYFVSPCGWFLSFRDTVNAKRYKKLFTQFISLLDGTEWDCWLQDNAIAHMANSTMAMLEEFCGDIISKNL